jgi:hypothetical protein
MAVPAVKVILDALERKFLVESGYDGDAAWSWQHV